jgi:uncharacterized protein (TIGR03435 family)
MRALCVGTVLAATLVSAWGQPAPQVAAKLEFEATVIKPVAAPSPWPRTARGNPERVYYNYASIRILLMRAYNLPLHRVIGPAWIDSEHFEVEAVAPEGSTKEQTKIMLQNLLADRFKLKVHRETRELPLYELIVEENGSKLKESAPNATSGPRTRWTGRNVNVTNPKASIADLVLAITSFLDRPTVDRTGLTGVYDLKLTYTPDTPANQRSGPDPNDISIFTAIREQLGLKLVSKKGPLDVVVVDQGQKMPTEN